MIKTILTTAVVALTAAPVFADTTTSPAAAPAQQSSSFSTLNTTGNVVPSLALASATVTNNISCRSRARAKYFELGARDMSNETSNAQWATVGNMQAVVWCRDTQAVIAVAGGSFNAVGELRDEISKAF